MNMQIKENNPPKKIQKDRLGSAIVSLILSLFSIIFLIIEIIVVINFGEPGLTASILAFALAIIGMILGVRAKNSSKGKGMAITGFVLSVPAILPIIVLVFGIVIAEGSFIILALLLMILIISGIVLTKIAKSA